MLNRAYELFGGKPELKFEIIDDLIPEDLKDRLATMTNLTS